MTVAFYYIICKVVKNTTFKESGALSWHLAVSRFPYSLMELCCTLSNNPWLIREFVSGVLGVPRQAFEYLIYGQKGSTECSWNPLLFTWLLNILMGLWKGLEHAAEQIPSHSAQHRCPTSALCSGRVFLFIFLGGGFFKCWLFFNFSSLVNFKIKYRTTRGLLSHCFTVCSKNSPFSLTAGSVLGHFYNLFSSSVSKLTRLSCFYHSCLGGCSKSLLLWELQASCNENVSPVLNSLTAICAFVLVPELSFQLKSFSLRMPQLCRCLSSRHLY